MGGRTYTREDFGPSAYTEPKPPTRKLPAPADPRAVQTKLAALGYLPTSAVTGKCDYRTQAGRARLPGAGAASRATASSGR